MFSRLSIFSIRRRATFQIKFLDADGFVLHEAKAGDYSVKMEEEGKKSEEKGGSEPVLSNEDYKDQIFYFGSIDSDVEKISKINNVRVVCVLTQEMTDILNGIIKSEEGK